MRTIRTLAVLATLVLLAAGCGDDDTDTTTTTDGPPATDDTTTTTEAETTTTTTTEGAETTDVSVYFLDGEVLKVGYVRTVEGMGVAAAAVEELLAGPNTDDEALGLSTSIPDGTELLGLNIVDNQATIDLSGEFESGGGSLSMNARLAQVVYTVTQFPSVESVVLQLDGDAVDVFGGEGLLIDGPLTRADFEFPGDFETMAPNILVETPRPGETVSDEIRVAGRANTFEAALYFEVTDADGEVIVPETYGMATSGTGTPGDFDEVIELPGGTSGEIILLAYEISMEDGSRTGVSEVPLVVE
ncbi:MAG: GerMN domain-containing protein [Acidimicrobiales bacterium]